MGASYTSNGIALADSVPRAMVGGAYHAGARFTFTVPAGANRVTFTTSGGTGDVTLFASNGVLPETPLGQYQKKSAHVGNAETITVTGGAVPGTWNLLVYGKADYDGLRVTAHYWNERTWASLTGDTGSMFRKTFFVPPGSQSVTISIRGDGATTGEADLYVRLGTAPTLELWHWRPFLAGNDETVTIPSPLFGTYHLMVYARTAYTGVTLSATTQ